MMANRNFAEDYFNRVKNDANYRQYLKNNPKKALCELHHVNEDSLNDVEFQIIEQADDAITIMIPARPNDYTPEQTTRVKHTSDQTIDFLHSSGLPGFLIPNDDLRWVLLNMRKSWLKSEGIDLLSEDDK